jgi:hypothetical protein
MSLIFFIRDEFQTISILLYLLSGLCFLLRVLLNFDIFYDFSAFRLWLQLNIRGLRILILYHVKVIEFFNFKLSLRWLRYLHILCFSMLDYRRIILFLIEIFFGDVKVSILIFWNGMLWIIAKLLMMLNIWDGNGLLFFLFLFLGINIANRDVIIIFKMSSRWSLVVVEIVVMLCNLLFVNEIRFRLEFFFNDISPCRKYRFWLYYELRGEWSFGIQTIR